MHPRRAPLLSPRGRGRGESAVPGVRLPLTAADRSFLVRWFAYSYGFCTTVVLASLPFIGERVSSPLGIAASAALTYGLVAVMLAGRDRLPGWVLQGLPFAGTAVVTAILFSTSPGTAGAFAFLYFVVALAAIYSCGLLTASSLRARSDSTIAALSREAATDPLTGLLNRRGWERRLDEEFERARRGGRPFTVAFADLDGLKRVNDESGHAVGDAALTRFAHRIERTMRLIDAASRLGGDEFALVLPDTDATGAMKGVNRVRASARQAFDQAGLPLSASFGLADYPAAATTLRGLMQAADAALYEAKAGGGDRVVGSSSRPQLEQLDGESTNA